MAPISDGISTSVNGTPNGRGAAMKPDRLAIRLERPPLDRMDACNGLYTLEESGESIILRTAGYAIYIRREEAKALADALYRYDGAIEADKERYTRAREWLGRKVRNGDVPGFEDTRIHIETTNERG